MGLLEVDQNLQKINHSPVKKLQQKCEKETNLEHETPEVWPAVSRSPSVSA